MTESKEVSKTYKVRRTSKPQANQSDAFRVYFAMNGSGSLRLSSDDICTLSSVGGHAVTVTAFPAMKNITDGVIQISETLKRISGLSLGDEVSITASQRQRSMLVAKDVSLREVKPHWKPALMTSVLAAKTLSPGMEFEIEDKNAPGHKRVFTIDSIGGSKEHLLYTAQPGLQIQIVDEDDLDSDRHEHALSLSGDGIGGVETQLDEIRTIVRPYAKRNINYGTKQCMGSQQRGILLHGASGTGKSEVLRSLSEAGWQRVFHIDLKMIRTSKASATIQTVFKDARAFQPSLIVIDNLDLIAGETSIIGPDLCDELDRLGDARVLVAGATRKLSDIYQHLRDSRRFSEEIEIPIPNEKARSEILKVLTNSQIRFDDSNRERIAARTHGYVGSDLVRLITLALRNAVSRMEAARPGADHETSESHVYPELIESDLDSAFRKMGPKAMQGIIVETPHVRWGDIAGLEAIKKSLEKDVVWPLKFHEKRKPFGLKPRKATLLYGPPGCGKTMLAKALANETDRNFLAVKGAELLNMYVGESERALRDVFNKARAVSPSIIFFDEIDTLAGKDGAHAGVQIESTFLNELDGITELKDVFVLAATNRPENMSPALTRSGRLNPMLYIGTPDLKARQHIFENELESGKIAEEVDFAKLALETEGYSGAEIESICQGAGEAAFEEEIISGQSRKVEMSHYLHAIEREDRAITQEMIDSYQVFTASKHRLE